MLVPNFDAAPAVVNLVFLALLVLCGGFFPIAGTSVASHVAQVLRLRPLLQAAFAAFSPSQAAGWPYIWQRIAVLAGWGAAALAFALRRFRRDSNS